MKELPPALKLAPILDDLDRYELQIAGLTGANYELSIDGGGGKDQQRGSCEGV